MTAEANQLFKWFGIRRTAKRFDRVAFQLGLARQSTDPDTVHDLRVSVRRLFVSLDCFEPLFDKKDLKNFRSRTRKVLKSAGDVRDYDIALQLAAEAGIETDALLCKSFSEKRRRHALILRQELRRGGIRKFSMRWRGRLGLH